MFLRCVGDEWRDIYSEEFFFPYLLPGARGCQRFPPCKLVRDASDRLRVPRSTAILYTLSKSDRVVLITWSPSGYTPVRPECPDRAFLFTNHNVTACQSTRGHEERTENPWHMLCNINPLEISQVNQAQLVSLSHSYSLSFLVLWLG